MHQITTGLVIVATLILLSGCQEAAPSTVKTSADEYKGEKALSSSVVNIVVGDGNNSARREILFSANGFTLPRVTAKAGETLKIINSTEQQVNLYTTEDGNRECNVLGQTLEIPGLQSKEILLSTTFLCTIINQENTDQKVEIEVV